ncbi:BEN domain-containing protein 5-like isoform X1 [Rhipicephalus microplus]|uniref:BEN domain-containing protein 5-like isoform X1 n=1 Tax=Rhipicephalus microplus TaxID=6941 RepID=UPI003F6B7740
MLQNELKTLASRSCCGHQCSTSTNHGAYEHEATHRSIQEKARPLQFMQPSPPSPPPPSPPLPSPPPWPCSPLSPQGWSATLPLPPPQHLLLPEPPSPSSEQPRMQPCPLMPPVPHPGTTSSGSQEPTSQGLGASDELPLFFQVDNQIHLGNGIFLEQEKWAWLLSRPRDSLFCKEATKLLWGVSALHNRSITGAPCRRYVRSENQAPPRRALTPKKLEAVGNAFSKYIAGRPSETAPMERLRKMNRFIAEMLNDLNK